MDKINILGSWDKKVCLNIHVVVLLRGLPSLEGKNELLVRKKLLAKSSQTDYSNSRGRIIIIIIIIIISIFFILYNMNYLIQ